MGIFTSKKTTTQSVDMGPWGQQQPFLTGAWNSAQNLYNTQNGQPGYQGDFIATMNPDQLGLIRSFMDYYKGTGVNRADALFNNATTMTNTGMNGVINSANAINNFANSDRTGAIISDASRIADNPYMSSMVDASMRDAYRNASENTIPNLYRDAAAGSNLNSSRTALAQGVVERGLAQKTADVSSMLRGNAYDTGLKIGAGNQALTLDALKGAGGLFDSLNKTGLAANDLATNQRDNATERALYLSDTERQGRQMELDNNLQKFRYNEDRPWDLLNRYYGIVGSQKWGSTGTSTTVTKDTPSAMQQAASIIGMASDIGSMLFGLPSSGGSGGGGGWAGNLMKSFGGGGGSAYSGYNMTGLPGNLIV